MAYLIYAVLDLIVSLTGIALLAVSDLEYVEGAALIISLIVMSPIYIVYSLIISLSSVLYMVIPALYFKNNERLKDDETGLSQTEKLLEFIKDENILFGEITNWIKQSFQERNTIITNSKTNKIKTYDDGSYLVSCSLHCG